MKTVERDTARRLRREQGLPIKQIARQVGVAPSSVSRWVRDIELTESQLEAIRVGSRRYDGQLRGAYVNAVRGRARRRAYQAHGRRLARRGDALHVAGTMLYWAEGDKSNRHAARLVNSDPDLLRLFVRYLREYYDVAEERTAVTCHLFADHRADQEAIEEYWLDVLSMPRSCLRRSVVNAYSVRSARKRCNMLPYGTCRVCVNETRVLQSIFGAIQEYGGFERPEWLG